MARLNDLSTSTRSALSTYSVFLSFTAFFLDLPSEGPDKRMPCSLQISQIFSVSVNLVRQHPFQIVPRTLPVLLDGIGQSVRFVISVEGQFFQSCHTVFFNTQIKFCPELHGSRNLSANDEADVRLTDTDDSALNRVNLILIHVPLLLVHLFQDGVSHKLFWRKLHAVRQKCFHVPKIMAHILQLLLYRLPDLLRHALFALCQIQVILSCVLEIYAESVVVVIVADLVNHLFQIFSGLV